MSNLSENAIAPPLPDLTAWAARQLDVDGGLPANEVRRVVLEKLVECDFLPPRSWGPAVSVLTRPTEPLTGSAKAVAWEEESTRLSEEVEAFAGEIFDLPMDRRRAKLEELRESCAFSPALSSRLDWLKQLVPISVDCSESASADCRRLARELADALGSPRESRRSELEELIDRWKIAVNSPAAIASELRACNPHLAVLAPAALNLFAATSEFASSGFQPDAKAAPSAAAFRSTSAGDFQHTPWLDAPRKNSGGGSSGGARVGIGVAIAIVIGFVRLMSAIGGRFDSTPTDKYEYPYSNVPSVPTVRYQDKKAINKALGDYLRNADDSSKRKDYEKSLIDALKSFNRMPEGSSQPNSKQELPPSGPAAPVIPKQPPSLNHPLPGNAQPAKSGLGRPGP